MQITVSVPFKPPQYIYMTERESLAPILCQNYTAEGLKHCVLSELDPFGKIHLLRHFSFASDKKEGINWYLDGNRIEINRWVRKEDGREYLTELEFLPMAEQGTLNYPVDAYRVIFGYLGEDKYFCCDAPKGPILCKNFSGELLFTLPIQESDGLEINCKNNVIFAYDVESGTLSTFYPNGTEYRPPIQVVSLFKLAENYYRPEFGIENGNVVIWGFDHNYNYIKAVYLDSDRPTESRLFSPAKEFYFYRFAQHNGKALVHGYDGKMFCRLISTRTPGISTKEIFSLTYSGREPPFGDLIWVNEEYFVFIQNDHKKSKLTLYSTYGKRVSEIDVQHYIMGQEDVCTDGQYLYVLSHEGGQWQTHNTLTIIRVF